MQPLYIQDLGQLKMCGCPEDAWSGGNSLLLEGLMHSTSPDKVCVRCVHFLIRNEHLEKLENCEN